MGHLNQHIGEKKRIRQKRSIYSPIYRYFVCKFISNWLGLFITNTECGFWIDLILVSTQGKTTQHRNKTKFNLTTDNSEFHVHISNCLATFSWVLTWTCSANVDHIHFIFHVSLCVCVYGLSFKCEQLATSSDINMLIISQSNCHCLVFQRENYFHTIVKMI